MNIEDAARAEAERRYPHIVAPRSMSFTTLRESQQAAFVAGAAWQREQPDPLRAGVDRAIRTVTGIAGDATDADTVRRLVDLNRTLLKLLAERGE